MDIKNSFLADAINTLAELGKKAAEPTFQKAEGRTFQEVQQPASEFVFRVYEDRSISLTAADGGMWKLAARDAAKRYLTDALADEIEKGLVIVTL